MAFKIEKTWVLSYSHISKETRSSLDKFICVEKLFMADSIHVGTLIYVKMGLTKGSADDLKFLIGIANDMECSFIRFESSGPIHKSLPIFNHEDEM